MITSTCTRKVTFPRLHPPSGGGDSGGGSSGGGGTTTQPGGGEQGGGNSGSGNSGDTSPDKPAANTITPGRTSTTPKPVSGTIVVTPSKPGNDVTVKVDGKPIDGNKIDTKQLTNGTHDITVTENGKTSTQKIIVHNPWPTAVANEVKAHKIAYGSGAGGLIVLGAALFFGRSYLLRWLRNRRPPGYITFGSSSGTTIRPFRKR